MVVEDVNPNGSHFVQKRRMKFAYRQKEMVFDSALIETKQTETQSEKC